MNIWNIATTLRTNVSFLWSFISQQPTEMTLGAIVGWIIGWNLFYLEKIHFIYLVVMVIVIVLSIFLIWYFGDFIWIKIKDILFLFIPFLFCICAILMSALLVFGEAVLIFLVVTGAVSLVSLAMVYGFDNIRLVISNAILDQLRNFFLSLIGTFFLSGFAVWGATFMPLLIGKSVFFYLASVAVAYLIMTKMNINGPGSREEIELDGLPPPSPETLSESRQQEVDGQFANPHGQASEEITLGTGHIQDENRSFREQPPTAPSTFQLVPVRTEQEQPPPPVANPTGPCHLKPSLDQINRQVLQSVDEHATQIMTKMNINGPGSREEIELDGLPPPSPETLSECRQQEVDGQFANPHDQASEEITLGIGHIQDENRSFREQPPTAPSIFQLVSVRIEQEQPPPPVANPTGPCHLKPSLDQIDRQVLQSVDEHATQVSTYQHPSFRELIWNLVFSKNISNELEIVRAIFKWLSTKNLKDIVFNNVGKGSPEEVLLDLKEGKTTYAKVFDTLCNYAGVHSRIICGYAKGVNYKPGMKFHPDKDKHTWNAVYINGNWGLVDADWAARRIIEKQWKCKYQLNEHFFLPDPNHFIYEHFPDDDRWQLLDRPITLEEFENKPHIKPEFFTYGLEIVSHKSVIIDGRGEVNVRLKYPALKQKLDFDLILQFESGEEEEYKGTKLNRYGMQESVEGIASFRLRLPVKGSYILSIYVKEYKPENIVSLHEVCEYKIVQEEVSITEPHPFPPCTYLNWGPSTYFYRYGLATNQQTAQILIRDGKAELQIIIPNQMQFMTTLKHNDQNDEDLQGYATHRIVGNTVYFNITAPSRGEYGLEIHANDPATKGSTLYQVAQYLVECNEDVQTVPLPKMSAGYLGAKPKFNDYGLDTLSHHIPVIHLEANTVEIQFSVTQEIRVNAKLIEVESDRETPKFVFIQTKDSVVSFIVNCPSVGFYKLQLYAIPVHDPSQQLPGVYNYLINCQRKTNDVFPFPKLYGKWTEGCYMWEPLIVHNEIEKPTVNFHVRIPKAEDVVVVVNQEWTHLKSSQPEIWEGEVNLAPYYGEGVKVTLNAFFGGDNTGYPTLLEYSI